MDREYRNRFYALLGVGTLLAIDFASLEIYKRNSDVPLSGIGQKFAQAAPLVALIGGGLLGVYIGNWVERYFKRRNRSNHSQIYSPSHTEW